MTKAKSILIVGKAEISMKALAPSADLIAAVEAGNGKARNFVFSAADLVEFAKQGEARLDRAGLPQADRVGFEMTVEPAGPAARSYKYAAPSRSYDLRRTGKGWVLVAIGETTVYPTNPERVRYAATPAQMDEIARRSTLDLTAIKAA